MAGPPIPSLRGTPMHVTAIELYQGHHGDPAGTCVRCGLSVPCPARQHAAYVIVTVGEDPRWYDGRLNPAPTPGFPVGTPEVDRALPVHVGYPVGGRGGRMRPEGFGYEREPEH